MKYITTMVIVLVVVLWGYYATRTNKIEYVQPEPQIVEKEVSVPETQKREQEALMASSTEIQAAMDAAAQEAKRAMETEIKLNVNRKMQAELKEQEAKLEESVSL